MRPESLSLVHAVREPMARPHHPPPLLLFLHGMGRCEDDGRLLAPVVDGRFCFVSVRAPLALGSGAFAWYHSRFPPGAGGPTVDVPEAEASRLALLAFLDELVAAYGLDARRVYLAGFSQGGAMVLSLLLTRPDRVAGAVAMSCRILHEALPAFAEPAAFAGRSVLIVQGTRDAVLPAHHAQATRDRLAALPVRVAYREHPIGHEMSRRSRADVGAWLKERLDECDGDARA